MFPATSTSKKRKATVQSPLPRKKKRNSYLTTDSLPWRAVSRPKNTGLDGDEGILELEEVEGVEVSYEDTAAGRVAKFNVTCCISFRTF